MTKQSIPNIGVFLLGMQRQKAVREGDASLAGGPFFQVVAMRRCSLIIQSAMTEVGWN
jgi:hypothetical protein